MLPSFKTTVNGPKWPLTLFPFSSTLTKHSDAKLNGVKLGENIAMRWSSGGADYDGDGATNQWYSEIGVHDFSSEPRSLASGESRSSFHSVCHVR